MPSIQQLCCYISLANNKEYYLSIESKWLGQERIKLTQIIFGAGDDIFTKKKVYIGQTSTLIYKTGTKKNFHT